MPEAILKFSNSSVADRKYIVYVSLDVDDRLVMVQTYTIYPTLTTIDRLSSNNNISTNKETK